MSVAQAKSLTVAFGEKAYAPPPRSIADITAILDSEKPDESYRAAVRVRLDEPPPVDTNLSQLAEFYARRSLFALQAGMGTQAVADARESVRYARESNDNKLMLPYRALKSALTFVGEPKQEITRELYTRAQMEPPGSMGSMSPLLEFTGEAIRSGNAEQARQFVEESDRTLKQMASVEPNPNGVRADNAQTHAVYELGVGHLDDAERWARTAIDYARDNTLSGPEVRPTSFSHPRFSRPGTAVGVDSGNSNH
jgi:hypothetical protein